MFKHQRSPKAARAAGKIEVFGWKKVKTSPFSLFQSFVMRYKGTSEHWIGLLREDEEQPWQWVNRSLLSQLWVHVFHFYVVGWCFLSHKLCISSSTWGTSRGSNGTMSGKGNIASGTDLCFLLWPKRWERCIWWENPKFRFFYFKFVFFLQSFGFHIRNRNKSVSVLAHWCWINSIPIKEIYRDILACWCPWGCLRNEAEGSLCVSFLLFPAAPSEVGYLLCPSRFRIRGGGLCAYLDDNGLSSSHCSTERSWICNKHELQSSGKGNRMRRPPNLCVSSLGAAGRPSHTQIAAAP